MLLVEMGTAEVVLPVFTPKIVVAAGTKVVFRGIVASVVFVPSVAVETSEPVLLVVRRTVEVVVSVFV